MSEHNENNLVPQVGESSAVACRPELNGLPNEVLLLIIKLVREHGNRTFFELRRVHPRWNNDIFPMFTEKITTLCLASDVRIANCSFDSFYDDIEPDTAVDIRLRSLARDCVATLVDRYPSVTQLIIKQSRLVLATNWHETLTHLSLHCDCTINQDPSVVINTMTSLQYLDMKNYPIEVLDNMGPTLGRIEHLSFDNHRDDCLPRRRHQDLDSPELFHLAYVMSPNCKRFWISNLTRWINSFYIWHESNPLWLAGLTHFALDLNDDQRDYDYEENWLNKICECMPSLQVLHTKGLIGQLDTALVNKIGQLAHLRDIRIYVDIHHEQLFAAVKANALTPWTAVRNFQLTISYGFSDLDDCNEEEEDIRGAIEFLQIVSTIAPNLEHLSMCIDSMPELIVEKIMDYFIDHLPITLLTLKLYIFNVVDPQPILMFSVKRLQPGGKFELVHTTARRLPVPFDIKLQRPREHSAV